MQAQVLNISYSVWKDVVQENEFTPYFHEDDGTTQQGTAFAGTDIYIYTTRIVSETWVDFNTTFFFFRIDVGRHDDAMASIVGLISVPSTKRSPDGTVQLAFQPLQLGRDSFRRTDDGSELMNIDATSSGSAVVLWNGTGVGDTGADWTASSTGAATGVESAAAKKEGTNNGWDTTITSKNDRTVFDNGSTTTVSGVYSDLQFWMQPKAYPPGATLNVLWENSIGQVGKTLKVENYVSNMDLDIWQRVSIPINDFDFRGDPQELHFVYDDEDGQRFWFDDIDLISSTGGPFVFRCQAPDEKTVYHLSMAVILLSAPEAGWEQNAFANIASGISNGLLLRHRRLSTGEVLWKFNSTNNTQLFGQFHPQDTITFADGEMLVGFMVKPGRATVEITNDDVLEFLVRDDLSSITEMRAYCHYGVEEKV